MLASPLTERARSPRTPDELSAWHRSAVVEPVLDPGLPIVDAHHHLWVRPPFTYGLSEFSRDLDSGHNIRASVFVECTAMYRPYGPPALSPLGETEFVNGIAAMSANGLFGEPRICAAIVGFADLLLGDQVAAVLERHVETARDRFRGIRNRAQREPSLPWSHQGPADLLESLAFRQGFAQLSRFGLTYDSWNSYHQIAALAEVARLFPETTVVLDHVGGLLGVENYEGRGEEIFDEWRKQLRTLAACPNAVVKIGGLGMLSCGFPFGLKPIPPTSAELAKAWQPFVETCIELFGPDRAMFESNFPVDGQSCNYRTLWNTFKRLTSSMTASERAALFSGTAMRVYNMAPNLARPA